MTLNVPRAVIRNPILPGHHPDPSICRVGDTYFVITSSFTFFPGLPIVASTDLQQWRTVGHVITRESQNLLRGLDISDGVWAPTIRHHEGTFYVVATVARERRGWVTFLSTAASPEGPWSDLVDLRAEGFDPSLFFDEDGRCWFTACRDAAESTGVRADLWMRELDLESLQLTGDTHVLWHGSQPTAWAEAPHIYKRSGEYFLIAAEGGTERNHAVTAARSSTVTGPYEGDARNPLLTHRHREASLGVQNVGHADLVDSPDGRSWAVVLATRPIDSTHTLGRETFLVPFEWQTDGIVFAPGVGMVEAADQVGAVDRDPFVDAVGLRGPWAHLAEKTSSNTWRMRLAPETLAGRDTPSFIARPQEHVDFSLTADLHFHPSAASDEAGLVAFQNQDRFASLTRALSASGDPVARLTLHTAGRDDVREIPASDGAVRLRIVGDNKHYTFEVADAADWHAVGRVARSWLSTEYAGGFVGTHLGLYATSHGRASTAEAGFVDSTYVGFVPPVSTTRL